MFIENEYILFLNANFVVFNKKKGVTVSRHVESNKNWANTFKSNDFMYRTFKNCSKNNENEIRKICN